MAEVLKTFDFSKAGTRSSKYPWDEWCDGKIRRVVQGKDFESKPTTFRSALHNQASRREMKVRAHVEEKAVVFQFYSPNGK